MLRVQDDDAAAFEQLVQRYEMRVLRLMMSWVNSREQAEDLVQEVFLRVYRSRKTYEPTAKFATWLFRIANNLASNSVRDRSRRKEYQLAKGDNTSTAAVLMENIALAPSGCHANSQVGRFRTSQHGAASGECSGRTSTYRPDTL